MKKRSTKGAAALLAAALILSLTACGGGGADARLLSFQTAQAYTSEDIPLPVETGLLYGCCAGEDCMYLLMAGSEERLPSLYRVPLDSGEAEKLEEYRLPENEAIVYTNSVWGPFLGGDGKLWLWEQYSLFHHDFPDDSGETGGSAESRRTGPDDFCHLRQLDPRTGRELNVIDAGAVVKELGPSERISGLTVDRQGTVYIAAGRKIHALDSEGTVLFTLNAGIAGSGEETLALLPDGTAIALVDNSEGSREVRTIDPAAKGWGETSYSVLNSVWGLTSGSGAYQFFFQRNNILYGRREGELLDERLLRWEDAGLGTAPNAACVSLLDGGRAAVLTWSIPEGGNSREMQIRLQLLTPSDKPASDGKIRLVYGTIGDDGWARTRVDRFNKTSNKYYVELRDYAEGMLDGHGSADYTQIRDAALRRLSAEMIAGRMPDILDNREIPLTALARQGILTDLWPFIDNDPELGRDGVMAHVLECAETDGKLYQVFSTFRIDTLVANRAVVGTRTCWTLEEMLSVYGGTLPEIYQGVITNMPVPWMLPVSGEDLLNDLLRMSLDRYIDWTDGTCSFDSEEFRDILRLCAGKSGASNAGPAPAALWTGQPVVYLQCLASLEDLAVDDAIFGGPEILEDYEARMAENGVTVYPAQTEGGRTGVTAPELRDAAEARETGLYRQYPVAADFVTGTPGNTGCASYIGFPTRSGHGSCFRVNDCLAITESCQDKEGAWAFVRQLLLPDGNLASLEGSSSSGLRSSNYGFPVNRADFERNMEPKWITDEAGEYLLDQNGERIEQAQGTAGLGDPVAMIVYLTAPGPGYQDKFMALYEATDQIFNWDSQDLLDIITEQARPYFSGDKSLAETAKLIQNRAELYVNENR